MAHSIGLVVSIKEAGKAQVVTDRKNACGGCGSTHNCNSCLSNSKIVTETLNSIGAKEGDLVDISLDSGVVLKSAATMYLIPVAGLMAGALTGVSVSGILSVDETISAIIFSIIGLCLGFIMTALISKRMSMRNRLTPVITQIIKPEVKHSRSSVNNDPFHQTKVCSTCH
jgi:sigma-E factor negative regulatory protein RseC